LIIHLFHSGDAGTGKSVLFNTIIHAAKHILREEGDFLDQPRVLSLAPSKTNNSNIIYLCCISGGVAATIIEGRY
jgi:hypothetical protein